MPRKPAQPSLFPAPRASKKSRVTSHLKTTEAHEERNREAGARILIDPERFGGENSLPVQWARAVTSKPKD
jgi:hypothetical protein